MPVRWKIFAALGISASLVALTTMGCELLALADRTLIPIDGEPTGGGGPGGATGSGGRGGSACVAQSCDQGTSCQEGICVDGGCILVNLSAGTPCVSGGNAVYCDDAGGCNYECLTEHPTIDDDCSSRVCHNHLCQPPACDDGSANGDETDVDCGGPCPACADGQGCNAAGDCVSRYCDTGSGGGSGGGGGGGGSGTAAGICADCTSDGDCDPGEICALSDLISPDDHCISQLVDGAVCDDLTGRQCASGFCPSEDLVCCNTACDEPCRACVAAKSAGITGVCGAIPANTDPDNECGGAADFCDGIGECAICGDGSVQATELCDDGYTDACGSCNADCKELGGGSACGDGTICPETESCEDFNADACGSCNADCNGPGTGACATGVGCGADSDCTSGWCWAHGCVYAHTIIMDGNLDFAAVEQLPTTTAGYTGYVAWDSSALYVGLAGTDVALTDGTHYLLVYVHAGTAVTCATGRAYGGVQPGLPFGASHHFSWNAGGGNGSVAHYTTNGVSWNPGGAFSGSVARSGGYVELRIPFSDINATPPATLSFHLSMISTSPGATFAGVPSTSFFDAPDPDYTRYFAFAVGGLSAPLDHAPTP